MTTFPMYSLIATLCSLNICRAEPLKTRDMIRAAQKALLAQKDSFMYDEVAQKVYPIGNTINQDSAMYKLESYVQHKILLFALKAGSGSFDVRSYYFNGPSNTEIMAWSPAFNLDKYRSLWMQEENKIAVSNITLALYKAGNKECELTFAADWSSDTDWMLQSKLIGANPWNVEILKTRSFDVNFGISGEIMQVYDINRMFKMTKSSGSCSQDQGAIQVSLSSMCTFEEGAPPVMIWAYNSFSEDIDVFQSNGRYSDYLVVEGFVKEPKLTYKKQ